MTTKEIIKDNIKNRKVVRFCRTRLTHDEWFKRFKPIKVTGIEDLDPDGYGFIDMGQEAVQELIESTPDNRIWTLEQAVEAYYLNPGYDRHNGTFSTFYICEVPCEDFKLQVREEIRRYSSNEATKKAVEADDVDKLILGANMACDWLLDLADVLEYSPKSLDLDLVGDIRDIVWRLEQSGIELCLSPAW